MRRIWSGLCPALYTRMEASVFRGPNAVGGIARNASEPNVRRTKTRAPPPLAAVARSPVIHRPSHEGVVPPRGPMKAWYEAWALDKLMPNASNQH